MQAPEWGDYQAASREAVRQVLEERMHGLLGNRIAELAANGVHNRRNGAYQRWLLTGLGAIELSVPRSRTGSAMAVLERYARREPAVDRVILACFVLGLSTRKVDEALLPLLGERISPATVSRVAQVLDQAVAAFRRRPLANRCRALILDGVVLSRRTGDGALRRPVLVALGLTLEGKKEILDFRLARSESHVEWEAFLHDLHQRGLTGESLAILVTEGGAGLLAALPLIYPPRAATRRLVQRWDPRYPAAVRCLVQDLDALLEFLRFEDRLWRQATRTTNAIERRFVEVCRRTRLMGVFSDRTSMERILSASLPT